MLPSITLTVLIIFVVKKEVITSPLNILLAVILRKLRHDSVYLVLLQCLRNSLADGCI